MTHKVDVNVHRQNNGRWYGACTDPPGVFVHGETRAEVEQKLYPAVADAIRNKARSSGYWKRHLEHGWELQIWPPT